MLTDLMQFAGTKTNPAATLFLLLILLIQSFGTAALLWLLQFCYKHTPGFSAYYQALTRIYNGETRRAVYGKKSRRFLQEIVKPLGLCVYCQSVYASAFIYWKAAPEFTFINLFLQIGLTYFFTELMGRIIYPPKQANEIKPTV